MTDDHRFVDSDGREQSGRDRVRRAWEQYFSMVPDFRIRVEHAFSEGRSVALFGVAEGTFLENGVLEPRNHWVVPAAWRVVIEDGRVAVWQLYVNPEPMVEICRRIGSTAPPPARAD
jgi:hypothetical protein